MDATGFYFFEGLVAPAVASGRLGCSGSLTVIMNASDTMSLRIQGQGAVGNTAAVAGLTGPYLTWFSGVQVS